MVTYKCTYLQLHSSVDINAWIKRGYKFILRMRKSKFEEKNIQHILK